MRDSGGGAIVNVSSNVAFTGGGSSLAYTASKGALNALTKALARTCGPEIRVNAVCPGIIDTRWMRQALGEDAYGAIAKRFSETAPLGRVATPEDVAGAIVWLVRRGRLHYRRIAPGRRRRQAGRRHPQAGGIRGRHHELSGPIHPGFPLPHAKHVVTARDASLYALSVGYGTTRPTIRHLCFLYERDLRDRPDARQYGGASRPMDKATGVDWSRLVHSEHRLTDHRPVAVGCAAHLALPQSLGGGSAAWRKECSAIFERVLVHRGDGEPVATIIQTNACRGDGGCGSGGAPPEPLPTPSRDSWPDAFNFGSCSPKTRRCSTG